MHEELGRCDNAGVATGIGVQTDMATPSLDRFGSEELKQKYLVPAISGEMVSAIAVTEPDAGSDVSRIRTRAVWDGDEWVINGSKLYITNAATPFSVADECVQLHGGYGYMKESAAGRAFVDTRIACVGGGSDETMKQYLAKQLGF
jgi:alkylation response protein AidB-like acyl-CoA dehydrogenase